MTYIENGKSNSEFVCSREIPNVFLLGDSIREGYCQNVKNELEGVAEVFYVNTNCRSTQFVITSLEGWKNKFDDAALVDIVHFNCGHWDIAQWGGCGIPLTSEEEYARNLSMLIGLIRSKFVNAKIVFATTTSMNPDNVPCVNPRSNDDIDRYNEIAVKVAKENGALINDLNKLTRNLNSESYADYCHFTEETYALLGKAVADKIQTLI